MAAEPSPTPGQATAGEHPDPAQAIRTPPPSAPDVRRDGPRGRHPTLRRAIARFVADLAEMPADATDATDAIEARWRAEVAEHLDGRTPATRKHYVMQYRAALTAALEPGHPALGVVSARGLAREITAARRRAPGRRPEPAERRVMGRPGVVRDAAAAFAARLAGSPAESPAGSPHDADPAAIERFIARLWAEELARHADKAPRTLKRIAAEHYRPAIRRALGAEHPALDTALAAVKPSAEVSDAIRRDDIARVAASHRAQVAVPNWREIVQRATALLASDAPLALVAGLLLVTGRRPYEVCCTGRFAPAPLPGGTPGARSRWTVLFSGQAKTKGRPGTRHDTAYEVPVLAEARAVIAALDKLRATPEGRAWAGMTNEEFRATTLRLALTEAVVRTYSDLWPEGDRLEPRALRPLYAEIAYKRFGSPGVTKNSFFAAVLGHTLSDLHTSLSYMDYHLPEAEAEVDEGDVGARRTAAGVTDRLLKQSRAVSLEPDCGRAPD